MIKQAAPITDSLRTEDPTLDRHAVTQFNTYPINYRGDACPNITHASSGLSDFPPVTHISQNIYHH